MLEKLSNWRSNKGNQKQDQEWTVEEVDPQKLPKHVAIIMDGNGRWAKKRGLPRIAGHHEGMKAIRRIVRLASRLGIETLTLYAFSTENWKRPKTEVDYLLGLPEEFLGTFLPELISENVQVKIIGKKDQLPGATVRAVERMVGETTYNNGLTLNFALNYGSRQEIVEAFRDMTEDIQDKKISANDISEDLISSYMATKALRDPDLLIRTSGELRLSNFMLWQIAYTELWFTDVFWPDFKDRNLLEAIIQYQRRGRRYGGV
ncbi:isoprenyl transferase [Aureibacillus halotolerans]|uniref:Isoprenyl transferase n=1 Tax=Aureibacillus halotolerans TaxID=1508390 RepID=A0A4R6U070_9BACI|nr:isoprenyl transferase [Aureibacillus halotolerans]TDQ39678.1 undecaprenyl pyrophosphate synthetase [Aureibacillus halotolerans]